MRLNVLSAGAAKGVIEALAPEFLADTGITIAGTFGAVGAIRDRLLAGDGCDVLVLTTAMLEALARDARVDANSIAPIGRVYTGIAVRSGEPLPAITDRASLRASLVAARSLYCPDPERATAGIHFVKVLRELAIYSDLASRLRTFPSGAIAMGELARSTEPDLIGCTQITEINYTAGVTLVGALPAEFALGTVYAVAVCGDAARPDAARRFAALVAGPNAESLRRRAGFEPG